MQSSPMESPKPESEKSSGAAPTRQPWPMWPFVLSIAVFLIFYTWVQLNYRKPGKAFEPHQAMIDRKDEVVEKNLYGWHSLKPSKSEEFASFDSAEIAVRMTSEPLDKLLPEQLVYYLPRPPILLSEIDSFKAANRVSKRQAYPVVFEFSESLGSDPRLLARAFYKDSSLHIFLEWDVEDTSGIPKTSTTKSKAFQYAIPTDPFEGPKISAFLYLNGQVRSWDIEFGEPELAN